MVHDITWRALPVESDHWNSVWKRFWRLSQTGFFEALADNSATAYLVIIFDSNLVRARVSATGQKGGEETQALGRSRGGFSSKIHIKTDMDGLPLAFDLSGGQASDSPTFKPCST